MKIYLIIYIILFVESSIMFAPLYKCYLNCMLFPSNWFDVTKTTYLLYNATFLPRTDREHFFCCLLSPFMQLISNKPPNEKLGELIWSTCLVTFRLFYFCLVICLSGALYMERSHYRLYTIGRPKNEVGEEHCSSITSIWLSPPILSLSVIGSSPRIYRWKGF